MCLRILHPENLRVARLDVFAHAFDRGRIVLHDLDVAERLAAGLLPGGGMHRAQAARVDDQLLALGGETEALEQPRRVRIGRAPEDAVRPDDQRAALGRVDDLDWRAGFLDLEGVVFVAVCPSCAPSDGSLHVWFAWLVVLSWR